MIKRKYCVVIISLIFVGIFLSGCGNSDFKVEKITKKEIADQQKIINEYYEAINQGKYKDAYNLTSVNFQNSLSYENFIYQYKEYIQSVKALTMARLKQYSDKNSGVFNVTFEVTYKQKYPYGNGDLPSVHVVKRSDKGWRIDAIG